MITAQDIREKTFEKGRNGYDMASVDDYLEELADEIANAQKENAVLKSKMKVLVDKIEEYRSNEEALNMAILSAQKLAVQIESEARDRAKAVIAEAEEKSRAVLGSIDEERIAHERSLADAKAAKAQFIAEVKALCQNQINQLAAIDGGRSARPARREAAPAAEKPAEKPASAEEPPFELDLSAFQEKKPADKLESTQTFKV